MRLALLLCTFLALNGTAHAQGVTLRAVSTFPENSAYSKKFVEWIDAVNASSGTSARSATTASSADLRSNDSSLCAGCNCEGNDQRLDSDTEGATRRPRAASVRAAAYRTTGCLRADGADRAR